MAPASDLGDLRRLYLQARSRGAFLDLSTRAQWRLTGPDRVRYLNGQVSADVQRLQPGHTLPACVTTAKGKLCGLVHISAEPDALLIDAEPALREPLAARLERYLIADDAALQDVTGTLALLHCISGDSPPALPPGLEAEFRSASRFGSRPGWDISAPIGQLPRLIESLSASRVLLPPELVETLHVETGTPRWGAELTEDTLPAEAGLDAYAVDFHKGCYVGQEVISRIRSVGRVNRSLHAFTAAQPLAPGMALHPAQDPSAVAAGRITSAAWSFGLETWAALGYLNRASAGAALLARPHTGEPPFPIQVHTIPLCE